MNMRKLLIGFVLLISLNSQSQQINIETKFSEPFTVFQFMNSLSANAGNNIYKKLFTQSHFNNKTYTDLIAQFDSLNINYSYDFDDYPAGEKMGIDVPFLLNRSLILSGSMQEFTLRSMGLIPNEALLKLTSLITAFTPVYDTVIYQPSKLRFEEQLTDITNLIKSTNLNYYFSETLNFYNASWDYSVPFIFCFYPLPHSKGFTAHAVSNIAISPIADSLDNYKALLSVMMHEISHVLYDERSKALWNETNEWFSSNPSPVSRYAYSLFNEAMASAVGNGYIGSQLNGKEDTSRRLYGQPYINAMAKAAYPLVKEYILAHKPIDKNFVNRYIQLYAQNFSAWLADKNYLMTGCAVMSENASDFELFDSLYRLYGHERINGITAVTLEKLKASHATKIIVVNNDHKEKLVMIKQSIPELNNRRFNAGKDFTHVTFLDNKTYLIIFNNINTSTAQKLNSLHIDLPAIKSQ